MANDLVSAVGGVGLRLMLRLVIVSHSSLRSRLPATRSLAFRCNHGSDIW
jgi:hypothetical protein